MNMPLTGRPARQEVEEKTGRASNAYKEDFGAHLRGKRPVHNVLSEGVQADGGYLVPEEFERQIVPALPRLAVKGWPIPRKKRLPELRLRIFQ